MTHAEAIATGLTVGTTGDAGSCGMDGGNDGLLRTAPSPFVNALGLYGWLVFSENSGRLVAIYAFPGIHTPQGIGDGSSYAQLHAAYPDWYGTFGTSPSDGRGWAKVPGNPNAHYRIVVAGGKVVELSLDDNHQDCYE
jgi:hypothetical protein